MSQNMTKSSSSATSPAERTADTTSSVYGVGEPVVVAQTVRMGAMPTPPMQVVPTAPNTAFGHRSRDKRSRSVSPRPRHALSPWLSIAQQRARTAESKAEMAISRAGQVADQALRAQHVAKDAIAEARTVRSEVEWRMGEITRRAEASTSSAVGELSGQVKRAEEQSWSRTTRVVGAVASKWIELVQMSSKETLRINKK